MAHLLTLSLRVSHIWFSSEESEMATILEVNRGWHTIQFSDGRVEKINGRNKAEYLVNLDNELEKLRNAHFQEHQTNSRRKSEGTVAELSDETGNASQSVTELSNPTGSSEADCRGAEKNQRPSASGSLRSEGKLTQALPGESQGADYNQSKSNGSDPTDREIERALEELPNKIGEFFNDFDNCIDNLVQQSIQVGISAATLQNNVDASIQTNNGNQPGIEQETIETTATRVQES